MAMQKNKVTVRTIAQRAGVSPATVSRVLSQADYNVNASLRKKVIQTAEEAGFFVKTKETAAVEDTEKIEIAMIVPNLSNPYFWQIAMGVESEAHQKNVNVYLCNSLRETAQETKYMHSLHQKGISGILLSPISTDYSEIIALQKQGMNIVLLEQSAPALNCRKVLFNYLSAAKMAMSHLTTNGHSDIAFVTSPITQDSRRDIFLGYQLGLLDAGLTFQENHVITAQSESEFSSEFYEYELGRACSIPFTKLIPRPTAVLCLNDMIALGFIAGLQSMGIRVPQDVSVIGLDNIHAGLMSTPTLTTVSQPAFEIGKLAYKMLMEAIRADFSENLSVSVEPYLVERESVAPLGKL